MVCVCFFLAHKKRGEDRQSLGMLRVSHTDSSCVTFTRSDIKVSNLKPDTQSVKAKKKVLRESPFPRDMQIRKSKGILKPIHRWAQKQSFSPTVVCFCSLSEKFSPKPSRFYERKSFRICCCLGQREKRD